jgi:hypothetical protein
MGVPSISSEKDQGLHLENAHSLEPEAGPGGPSKKLRRGDAALEVLGDGAIHHDVTAEEDRRVLRKIDLWVMPVVLLVYFLQQLDKFV